MYIPQYSQVSDAQRLAARETIAAQQKQALMFSGGSGSIVYRAPDMGGNNPETQALVNKLTQEIANQNSQASYDYRGTVNGAVNGAGTGGKGRYKTHRDKRTHRKKCKTRRKKHNKRISKRRHYKQ